MSWLANVMARTGRAVYPRADAGARPALARGRSTLAAVVAVAAGCQANLFTIEQDAQIGANSYAEILTENEGRLKESGPEVEQATRVTEHLVAAARTFEPEIVDAFEWEVAVIDDPDAVNAFALPGGKMACFTGILAVAGGDAGLAVVMGHEIAHVTKRHGTEAMTRQYGIAFLTLFAVAEGEDGQKLAALFLSRFFSHAFSREDELEADREGLMYMARAGYDPREAVAFWERMSERGGSAPVEWLSTHPSHGNRIARIQEALPAALAIYASAGAPE